MRFSRHLVFAALLGLAPAVVHAQVAFHGVGGPVPSSVSDATKVDSTRIYAVGGSGVNATLWIRDGADFVPTPLTFNFAAGSTQVTPRAITKNGAFIASQARGADGQVASRVTTGPLANINLAVSNLNLSAAPYPAFAPARVATAISDDGSILYGQVSGGTSAARAVRFNIAAGTSTLVPFPPLAGVTGSSGLNRGTSSDGSIMVAAGTGLPAGPRAFRYNHATGVSSQIPLLSGGTRSVPRALSSDGTVVLVAGNSTQAPNGEVYLYNATTGAVTVLGSPNPTWTTGGPGGMTSDGSVIAMSFSFTDPTGTAFNAFFHNGNGWFYLMSALARGGVDVVSAGWSQLQVTGMSSDGMLVFGQGQHAGSAEGFVAEFPAGFLAAFSAPPIPPDNTSIVGAWLFPNPTDVDPGVAVFRADGTFFVLETFPDSTVGGGYERGTYTWNALTGAFTVTTFQSTKGNFGLAETNGTVGVTVAVSGDSLTVTDPTGSFVAGRIAGGPANVIGAWGIPAQPDAVLVLLGDGRYYLADDGETEPAGHSGIEKGTYSWSPLTHLFSATPVVDTDGGDWGFSGAPPGGMTLELSPDGLVATGTDISGTFQFNRIVDPNAVRPVITSLLAAAGGLNSPFNYTVTTAWPALVTQAVGLPAGLAIDTTTGVISGTPTVIGNFNVALSTSNTVSAAGATLNLVISNVVSFGQTDLWIGLKNSDDAGVKFDLMVEGFRNGVLVTVRQLASVPGGDSTFNNAVLRQISTVSSSVSYGPGTTLSVRVSARIAVYAPGKTKGTARLWFNDGAANTRVETVVNGLPKSFYLASGFVLRESPGPGPKSTSDVFLDKAVGGNPFKAFGIWTFTF